MTKTVSVLVFASLMWLMPTTASAEWYFNAFLGQMSKINFAEPTADSPSAWGVGAGTNAGGIVGGEFDYSASNEFFGAKADVGDNKLRTTTGSVVAGYPIKIKGQTRIRPYGTFGGGLAIADRIDFFPDYDTLNGLPPQQANPIYNCLDGLPENPTGTQINSCGVSAIEEQETGYFGLLSFGGGVFGFIVNHVGVRADFRYFTHVGGEDGEDFNFWRTFGVVIN